MTYLPAQPPMRPLAIEEWPQHGFQFPAFYPDIGTNNGIRHIRLDHVMEFLLGDKLK